MIGAMVQAARQILRIDPPWWADVCACYGVTPARARALGRRSSGRRPDFPSGPKGQTYEEIWASRPRETVADIVAFYSELGSWPVFRQAYRRRYGAWPMVAAALPPNGVVLEYGCGIAPVTWWLARRRQNFAAWLVDVPGQALTFGVRRLQRGGRSPRWLETSVVTDEQLPSLPPCDVAVVTEVLEHVPHPLAVVGLILGALREGGTLLEDFYDHHGAGSPADLPSAARERPDVYALIRSRCRLLSGRPPESPEGGGVRKWVKR